MPSPAPICCLVQSSGGIFLALLWAVHLVIQKKSLQDNEKQEEIILEKFPRVRKSRRCNIFFSGTQIILGKTYRHEYKGDNCSKISWWIFTYTLLNESEIRKNKKLQPLLSPAAFLVTYMKLNLQFNWIFPSYREILRSHVKN